MPNQDAHPHSKPNVNPPKPQSPPPIPQQSTKGDPRENDTGIPTKPGFENEGEGNKTAARNYESKTERYIKSGGVDHAAQEAKQALDGPEGDALRKAEEIGRQGEPELHDTKPDGKNASKR